MNLRKQVLLCALAAALCSAVAVKAIAPVIVLAEGVELILGAASSGAAGSTVATLATATSGGASALWSGVVASLGAAVIYAGFKASDGSAVRFPVHSAHTSPPAPSGAAGTASAVNTYSPGGTTSPDASCGVSLNSQYCHAARTPPDPLYCSFDHSALAGGTGPDYECYLNQNGNVVYYASATMSGSSCPAGYTSVSGVCTLSNSRAVVADQNCDVLRTGTAFSYYTGDLDCAVSGNVKGTISGDTWTVGGVDQYGNPVQLSVKALSDGGTLISQSVATKINGNDVVTEKTVQLTDQGVPVVNTQTQRPGTITPSTTDQTVSITSAPTGSVIIPTSSGGGGSITFPDDYNREATQQAIKTDVHSMVTATSVSDPTPATQSDVSPLLFVSTFSSLLAWSLPSHTSTCPAPVVTAFETAFTVDTHCTIAASLGPEISASFALVWLLLALFIVLSA